MRNITVILLAGGFGSRFGGETPKQFLTLHNKPVIFHSLDIFSTMPEVLEVIIVADKKYHGMFKNYPNISFAEPGQRRQDSLYNGLQKVSKSSSWICVHDAARPLITKSLVEELFLEGKKVGAATLGIPSKATIKEALKQKIISKTLNRDTLWEIQTPQFMSKDLLIEGFKIANEKNITVTDDVSLVELLSHPVKIVDGSSKNIKITVKEDFVVAEALYKIQDNPLI